MTHLPRKLPFLVLQPRKYQNEEVCININIKKSHDHDSIMKRENIKSHYNKGFFFFIYFLFLYFFSCLEGLDCLSFLKDLQIH